MTGCIVERSVNLRMYNIVVEFYVRGEEFANHVFLFIVGIVSFFVS
jgi:hypothetical protein